jgi:hypothetical protein
MGLLGRSAAEPVWCGYRKPVIEWTPLSVFRAGVFLPGITTSVEQPVLLPDLAPPHRLAALGAATVVDGRLHLEALGWANLSGSVCVDDRHVGVLHCSSIYVIGVFDLK